MLRPHLAALAIALAASSLLGCATTGAASSSSRAASAAHARVAPDVHGDPIALLPAGAVSWTRLDAATLRASPHFEAAIALARDLGADLPRVERELGFDPVRTGDRFAFAVYLPPGDGASAGWPVFYVRGGFEREAVLTQARARQPGAAESEVLEEGVRFTVIGDRAFTFPAADVMLTMERALVRRVAARLSGEATRSALDEERFAGLWRAAGGPVGPFSLAADLAAMRGRVRMDPRAAEAEALEAVVARGEAPGDVSITAVADARDAAAAELTARTIDEAREEVAGQLLVRLAGLSRVLRDGVRTRAEGARVHLHVDAPSDDVRRLLRATDLLRQFTRP